MLRSDERPSYWTSGKAISVFRIAMPTAGISVADVTGAASRINPKRAPLEAMPQ